MSANEQEATADPGAASRHRFTVVGVYRDGRGIDPVNVSAKALHDVQETMARAGAQVVTRYEGEVSDAEARRLDRLLAPEPPAEDVATAPVTKRGIRKGRK